MRIAATNPASGDLIARHELHGGDEVARRLARAWTGYQEWSRLDINQRIQPLRSLADILDSQQEELAAIATTHMGKPIRDSRKELAKCSWLARHYLEKGSEYLEPEPVKTDASASFIRYDPLGPLLAVMPWNYPYWQVFRHAVPAAVAGNVILLKHANNVLGVALAIEEVLVSAGFPPYFLQIVAVDHTQVADIIADARVRGVTVTGSVPAGRSIARTAGENLKKTVLELGGSDPFIVFDDADLDRAASIGAASRLLNAGQSCISAKRFIVHSSISDEFIAQLQSHMETYKMGDPQKPDTTLGPIAREDLRSELHALVQQARDGGATLVCGGQMPSEQGYFYPPSILTHVDPNNAIAREELFGPVAVVMRFDEEDEAVSLANDSDFGLGASVWTEDLQRGSLIASKLEAGVIAINDMVRSDPRLPFGGVKDSGYGRELGALGAQEFTNVKSVSIGL